MAEYYEFAGRGNYTSDVPTNDNYQGMIRGWANRDVNVLPQHVIMSALDWSADRVYKQLRIPPLENTETFTITAGDLNENYSGGLDLLTMPVPEDLIEPIYIRRAADGKVFNSRIDRRVIYDNAAQRAIDSFTQVGNDYIILSNLSVGDVIELHYYRRLPGLDATYEVTAANYNAGGGFNTVANGGYVPQPDAASEVTVVTGTQATAQFYIPLRTVDALTHLTIGNGDNVGTAYSTYAAANTAGASLTGSGTTRIYAISGLTGNEVVHWLRDENERMLMYGALIEVFNYLDEPESMARYNGLFQEEIDRLNREQMRRFSMGGNVRVSYNGGGLL